MILYCLESECITSYIDEDCFSFTSLKVSLVLRLDFSREWLQDLFRTDGERLCKSFWEPEFSPFARTDIRNSGVGHGVLLVLGDVSLSFDKVCLETGVRSADL